MVKGFRKLTYEVRFEKLQLTSLEKRKEKERNKLILTVSSHHTGNNLCFVNEIRISVTLWITV